MMHRVRLRRLRVSWRGLGFNPLSQINLTYYSFAIFLLICYNTSLWFRADSKEELISRADKSTLNNRTEDKTSQYNDLEHDNVIDYYKCEPNGKEKIDLDINNGFPVYKELCSNSNKMKNYKGQEGEEMKNIINNQSKNVEILP